MYVSSSTKLIIRKNPHRAKNLANALLVHATNICERLGKIHQNLMKNNDSLRKQATHSTLLKNKSKKTVLIDDLLANRITTDESIKSVEFQDLQVFDSATENVSGNYYHRLKKGVLKGDIGVFALQLTFRLGKKEKRIKKNVGKAIDNLKQISIIKHQNILINIYFEYRFNRTRLSIRLKNCSYFIW